MILIKRKPGDRISKKHKALKRLLRRFVNWFNTPLYASGSNKVWKDYFKPRPSLFPLKEGRGLKIVVVLERP